MAGRRGADATLAADYRSRSVTIGNRVRASLPGDRTVEGVAADIDDVGRLRIDTGDRGVDGVRGRYHPFAAGHPIEFPIVGYPDNVLAADEKVVLHRHPHWKRLIGPVLLLLVSSAAAAFGAAVVNQQDWGTAKTVVQLVILAVWLLLVGWLVVWPFLNWLTTHFVITDRRVMFRHGVLTRQGIDIPLARINSVEFRHGLHRPDGAHRHADHRVGVTGSAGVPRHSASGARPLAAVSRSLRHARWRGVRQPVFRKALIAQRAAG